MIFKGKVTKVDFKICTFIIEDIITVYIGELFAKSDGKIRFPKLNSHVVITDGLTYNKILFAKNIRCSEVYTPTEAKLSLPYIQLLRNVDLKEFDAIKIIKIFDKILVEQIFSTEFLKSISWTQHFPILEIIKKMCRYVKEFQTENPFEESNFNVYTPTSHKFIEEGEKIDYMTWVHTVNSFKQNEYLIGYLEVSASSGFMNLRDSKEALIIKIAHNNKKNYSEKLNKLLNSFILVKNYYIFYEFTKNVGGINYIFVDIDQVEILFPREEKPDKNQSNIWTEFEVINRCSVTYNAFKKSLDCLLHCIMNNKKCFISLAGKNFLKFPIFNAGDVYETSGVLTSTRSILFNKHRLPVYQLPPDAHFRLKSTGSSPTQTIPEVVETIKQNLENQKDERELTEFEKTVHKRKPENDLISFDGIIQHRKTTGPVKYPQRPQGNMYIGMKGTEVHQINFNFEVEVVKPPKNVYLPEEIEDNIEEIYFSEKMAKEYVSIYCHNFNLLQVPLAVVDQMNCSFRYLENPREKKYLKPTMFSAVEPINYHVIQDFNSTIEYVKNSNWGRAAPLGASCHIPPTYLIWGPTLLLKLTTLTTNIRWEPQGAIEAPKLDLSLGLKGVDDTGPFDVFTNDDTMLKHYLYLEDHEYPFFRKAILHIKNWTREVDKYEELEKLSEDKKEELFKFKRWKTKINEIEEVEQKEFEEYMTEYLSIAHKVFNEIAVHKYAFKCRKLVRKDCDSCEKFFLIEMRPSEH